MRVRKSFVPGEGEEGGTRPVAKQRRVVPSCSKLLVPLLVTPIEKKQRKAKEKGTTKKFFSWFSLARVT